MFKGSVSINGWLLLHTGIKVNSGVALVFFMGPHNVRRIRFE